MDDGKYISKVTRDSYILSNNGTSLTINGSKTFNGPKINNVNRIKTWEKNSQNK